MSLLVSNNKIGYLFLSLFIEVPFHGYKVAIASNSYAAVLNLVKKVIPHLDDEVVTFLDLKEGSIKDEILQIQEINIPKKDDDSVGEKIVATTTNKICHQRYWGENKFDYLIIDEVGQVPMVTTIATTLSTKNLILIGDPNQLPQVKKGTQPNKNNLSTGLTAFSEESYFGG